MSKTKISVQSDSFVKNGILTHTVSIQTIDSEKFACVASDFKVRQINYEYICENGKIRCADVKNQ